MKTDDIVEVRELETQDDCNYYLSAGWRLLGFSKREEPKRVKHQVTRTGKNGMAEGTTQEIRHAYRSAILWLVGRPKGIEPFDQVAEPDHEEAPA